MSAADIYAAKAEECLRLAAEAGDLNERSRLIGLAARWHMMASEARGETKAQAEPTDWLAPIEDEPDASA